MTVFTGCARRSVSMTLLLMSAVCALFSQEPARHPSHSSGAPFSGTFADGLYRNGFFGFSNKVRYGWVERTEQMRDASIDQAKSQVLLAVFEHPPEVKGEDVNPAVIIAAENLSSYPGVKTAADYFDPLTVATTSQGFKVVNEPYETTVVSKPLVRSDFSKESGKLTMYQSSLVMLSKGYAISFTFIGGSEDEVEQLIEQLTFAAANPKK